MSVNLDRLWLLKKTYEFNQEKKFKKNLELIFGIAVLTIIVLEFLFLISNAVTGQSIVLNFLNILLAVLAVNLYILEKKYMSILILILLFILKLVF